MSEFDGLQKHEKTQHAHVGLGSAALARPKFPERGNKVILKKYLSSCCCCAVQTLSWVVVVQTLSWVVVVVQTLSWLDCGSCCWWWESAGSSTAARGSLTSLASAGVTLVASAATLTSGTGPSPLHPPWTSGLRCSAAKGSHRLTESRRSTPASNTQLK